MMIFDIVRQAIVRTARVLSPEEILPSASLTDDLGLDSGKIMELTFRLEEELGLPDVPILQWVDARTGGDARFTVANLVSSCEQLVHEKC